MKTQIVDPDRRCGLGNTIGNGLDSDRIFEACLEKLDTGVSTIKSRIKFLLIDYLTRHMPIQKKLNN